MKILRHAIPLTAIFTTLVACSGDDNREEDLNTVYPVDRTYVVFNPAFSELPVPNDLLFASEAAADGTMYAGDEPGNPVISGIDALEGNSLIASYDIEFTGSLDPDQSLDANSFIAVEGQVIPNPAQNIFLLPLTYPSGDALSQASLDLDGDGSAESVEVPTFAEALAYQQAVASGDVATLQALAAPKVRVEVIGLDGQENNILRLTPLTPLQAKTKYLVVVTGVVDAKGNAVYPNTAYETLKDPESNIAGVNPALVPLRPAIQGWERLAEGYFGFRTAVFEQAGLDLSLLGDPDIQMTLSFTTTASSDVLQAAAAPQTFFEESARVRYKQDAITKVVSGVYRLNGDTSGLSTPTDIAINQTLAFLLTSPSLPDSSPNPLYSANIAGAIQAGADYGTIASADASAAFVMQTAAAQAAIQVHDSGSAEQGDQEPYVDIASEALGTVLALSGGNPQSVFPVPAPREARFFRVDPASQINPALVAPAQVYQGQITLPQYQAAADSTGASLMLDTWEASATVGAAIDIGSGQDLGTTPPSDKVTYRFPFPEKKHDATVPLLAVMPDEATLGAFGISRPENGWPVVVFVHGIGTDRSAVLPMANALAFACVNADLSGPSGAPCFATVAIDQPLHGAVPAGSTVAGLFNASAPEAAIEANLPQGAPEAPSAMLTERHYNFTADASSAPVPMDYDSLFGSSGSLFINLSGFVNTRDRLSQMVLDLLNLNASLAYLDVDGDGALGDLDTTQVYMIGHSMGAIDGIPFMAINNAVATQESPFSAQPFVQASAFMNTGGGVARLLTNSQVFSPRILQGLAAASAELAPGTSGLESYLSVFQGIVDRVDPLHFAPLLASQEDRGGVLLTEIIGDGTADHPADHTIPNAADTLWGDGLGPYNATLDNGFEIVNFPAPLAGTEPLLAQFSAVKTADAEASAQAAVLVTRFTEGSHATPITAGNTQVDPYSSAAVFSEMVSEFVRFFAQGGQVAGSIVSNPEVVEP